MRDTGIHFLIYWEILNSLFLLMPLHIMSQCKGDVKWMGVDKMDYHPLSVSIAPSWDMFFFLQHPFLGVSMAYEMHVITCFMGPPQQDVLIAESIIFRTKKVQFQRYLPCSAYACDRKEVAGEDSHEDVDVVDIWCWSARMISLLISWRWSRGKTRDCLY